MHKQGVASRALDRRSNLGSDFGALFPTKRSGDIPTVELHSKIRRMGRTYGSTGEYESVTSLSPGSMYICTGVLDFRSTPECT